MLLIWMVLQRPIKKTYRKPKDIMMQSDNMIYEFGSILLMRFQKMVSFINLPINAVKNEERK